MQHEKVIYENDNGESIEISYSFPYFLQGLSGQDGAKASITKVSGAGQDGSTITNVVLADRDLQLQGAIRGNSKDEIAKYRTKLLKVFSPKSKGWLQYEYGNLKRRIRCQVESGPIFSKKNNSYKFQDFLIDILCPNPFWLDDIEISEEITTWIGGISFPLRLPTTFAMAGPRIINVVNNGDVETPVRIEILGPATNPKITLRETGEFIRIKKELTRDDVVTITTEFGNKRVELNGQNAFNILDLPYSTFFNLKVGDNVIEFTTEDETNNANVKISYRNRYLGV